MTQAARFSACPACDVAPLAQGIARRDAEGVGQGELILSLPTAHCAVCITDVERALMAVPGVRRARVNLTLRRVRVDAPGLEAGDLLPVLERIGYEAHELDPAALDTGATDRMGRDLLMRIGVAGFAMMNIMILSVAGLVRGRMRHRVICSTGYRRPSPCRRLPLRASRSLPAPMVPCARDGWGWMCRFPWR